MLIATEIASAIEVAPSYKEALANSISVKSQTKDWNSNKTWRIPWDISAWYGVYDVINSGLIVRDLTVCGR